MGPESAKSFPGRELVPVQEPVGGARPVPTAEVEGWIAPEVERIYAIMDTLSAHRATDVLWFSLAHPRWEFVFQPKSAPYLHLIEPWWKV